MFKEVPIARCLRLAFSGGLAGAALIAMPVHAQEVQRGERVEVTGSSIKRIDAETSLPVQIITRSEIDRLSPQNTEELLRSISATQSNGAVQLSSGSGATTSGVSTVSLRGLGARRTLVLVNGRRVAPFGGVAQGNGAGAVDVNTIPLAAIERIEVLKDGASAVYGSDAIAGVINFILRSDYKGALVEANYGQTTHHKDGKSYGGDAVIGFGDLNTDRFNVLITGSYQREDAIYGRQRQYSSFSPRVSEGNDYTSGNTFPANVVNEGGATRNPLAPNDCFPSIVSPLYPSNRCRFDPSGYVALLPKSDRSAAGIAGRFAINPDTTAYLDLNGTYNKVRYTIQPAPISDIFSISNSPYVPVLANLINANRPALTAAYGAGGAFDNGTDPLGLLFGQSTFLLPTTSPYYNQALSVAPALAGSPIDLRYRSFENGLRSLKDETKAARAVAGVKGSFASWDYDIGFLYTESRLKETVVDGYPLYSKLLPLLNSGVVNPFGASSAAVQQQILATNYAGEAFNSKSSLAGVNGRLSREVYNLPAGAISVAVGGDFRHEKYRFDSSAAIASGDVSGYGGNFLPTDNGRNVSAGFAEMVVPILKSLEADVAVRYDKYQGVGHTTNPKGSLRWQPSREFLIRGAVGTGFRAPSLDELYAPNVTGVSAILSDPLRCPTTGSQSDCGSQFQLRTGGNSKLIPEKSTSVTLGFVLEPTDSVHFGVDYFDTLLRNQIINTGVDAAIILEDADSANKYASLVTRAAPAGGLPGPIISINQTALNLFKTHTSGYDIDLRFRTPSAAYGRLTVGINGTYVTRFDLQNDDLSYTSVLANAFSNAGSVVPRWKHVATALWDYGPWTGSVTQNFQSGHQDYPSSITGADRRVGSYETFDLQASWSGIKNAKVTLGIKNVFDRDPPYSNVGGAFYFQSGYDPSYTDPRGRFLYGKLAYKFF